MHAIEKTFYLKVIFRNLSVSSTNSFFSYKRRYLFQIYILVLKNSFQIVMSLLYGFPLFCSFSFVKFSKLPSLYETFRDSRCYVWCCKELLRWYDWFNIIQSSCNYYYGHFSLFANLQF